MALPADVDLTVDAPARPGIEWHALSGWGLSTHRLAEVRRPMSLDELPEIVDRARTSGRPVVLRGAGRSYGDAALPTARVVLDLSALRGIGPVDVERGLVTVEPGVTVADLWQAVLPHGFWPPVVPGTMRPTIAGCVAMNAHGKNQYAVGPIGEHVDELRILLADGSERTLRPERDADLFWAVVGGAGLLGVITSVTLRLKRVASGLLDVTARPHRGLAGIAELFEARRGSADYLVGWIDAFDSRARGVTHEASHSADADAATLDIAAQELPSRLFGVVPRERIATLIGLCAGPSRMRAINALKYRSSAWRGEHSFRQGHAAFHFLLDYVPGWKAIYAPHGMIQHQSFVPQAAAVAVHEELLARCRSAGLVPWLAVYKRHRPDRALLSHSVDGCSLALDFRVTPESRDALWRLCGELDRVVLGAGGSFYLAKDSTASPETFRAAYPGLPRFREWKAELDPDDVFDSVIARRLGMFAES